MTAVEIVFFGLVMFVNEGVPGHAMLVDGKGACIKLWSGDPDVDCEKFGHEVRLYELSCKGNKGVCSAVRNDWGILGSVLRIEGESSDSWQVDTDEAWRVDTDEVGAGSEEFYCPSSREEGQGFGWIPSVKESLGEVETRVHDDCYSGGPECPLSVRFELPFGLAQACHFFHCNQGKRRCIKKWWDYQYAFGYEFPGMKAAAKRALVDTVVVRFSVEGEGLTIGRYVHGDGGLQRQEGRHFSGFGNGSGERKVILLVSNQRPDGMADEGTPHHHYDLFYSLFESVSNRAMAPPRLMGGESGRIRVSPEKLFYCERYLRAAEAAEVESKRSKLRGIHMLVAPHNPQECVVARSP